MEWRLSYQEILGPSLRVGFRNSASNTEHMLALACSQKDLIYLLLRSLWVGVCLALCRILLNVSKNVL